MKKIYLLSALVMLTIASYAQIQKNAVLLGGQLSYSNNKSDFENLKQKSWNAVAGLSLGKAIRENTVVGFNLNYAPAKQTYQGTNGDSLITSTNRYSVGVFYRKYKNLGKDFYFFAEGNAAFIYNVSENSKSSAIDYKYTQTGGSLALTPGFAYQVCKKLQFEVSVPSLVSLQYMHSKNKTSDVAYNGKSNNFSVNSSLSNIGTLEWLGIGFRLVL